MKLDWKKLEWKKALFIYLGLMAIWLNIEYYYSYIPKAILLFGCLVIIYYNKRKKR